MDGERWRGELERRRGQNEQSWKWPSGLETLDPVNIAGLFGLGDKPAFYFGSGDNNDFFSRDGGESWGDPGSACGDCDAWFADVAQADRVIQFLPRRQPDDNSPKGYVGVIRSSDPSKYPDASDGHSKTFVPSPRRISFNPVKHLVPYAASDLVLRGYRPLIKTLATEAPLPEGDYVFIDQALDSGVSTLLRTTSILSVTQLSDWADPSKVSPIGPSLPPGADIVQVSGGHFAPVYYVADSFGSVWKLDAAGTTWSQIVPKRVIGGTSVNYALRWFVDPYDPNTIYVLDTDAVKVSADGGENWFSDPRLTSAVTASGMLLISPSLDARHAVLKGRKSRTRFVFGTAGALCTTDFGVTWFPVLKFNRAAGAARIGIFRSDFKPRKTGRCCCGVRKGAVSCASGEFQELPPFQPPPPFDLLEFAALDY